MPVVAARSNLTFISLDMEENARNRLKVRLAELRKNSANPRLKGKSKTLEHRRKIAAYWNEEHRSEQAEVARRVNKVENKKKNDYTCPDCGREFKQVTRNVYGGHRKSCLHWKQMAEMMEEEMGQTLDEILESNP